MQNDAFRKYKKERPKLGNLFDPIPAQEEPKKAELKNSRPEPTVTPVSTSSPSSKKKRSKKGDKDKEQPKSTPESRKERRWALFKRSVEEKRKAKSEEV